MYPQQRWQNTKKNKVSAAAAGGYFGRSINMIESGRKVQSESINQLINQSICQSVSQSEIVSHKLVPE